MIEELRFHHIGYAVKNLNNAKSRFECLGYTFSDNIVVDSQDALVAYARKEDSPLIELLEPLSINSPVQKILDSRIGLGG